MKIPLTILLNLLTLNQLLAQTFLNADFESGNTGFTSDYQFAGSNSTEGEFTVRSDPQNWNGLFVNFGDHTTGSGKMLVVNGATSGNPAIWRQTISLGANTSYCFRAWTGTAVSGGPANLMLRINGSQVGPSFVLPASADSWVLWEQPWTSSAAASYIFEIVNANTSIFPNDFYVDDVSLFKTSLRISTSIMGSSLGLSWPADPTWSLFTSSSLATGSWSPVSPIPSTTLGISSLAVPISGPRAYYRLQRIP